MKKYLITPSLLNSWKYCIERGDLENFIKTLSKEPFETTEAIQKGFDFEDYMIKNYPDTKNGCYQVAVYKNIDHFVVYGRLDCLKAGVITDYKHTGNYDVGKFYNSYQTACYMELVPEAYQMNYLICDNFKKDKMTNNFEKDKDSLNLYLEVYKRENLKIDLREEIYTFMQWLEVMGLIKIYEKHWESKY